jgi:cell surface protein SprA
LIKGWKTILGILIILSSQSYAADQPADSTLLNPDVIPLGFPTVVNPFKTLNPTMSLMDDTLKAPRGFLRSAIRPMKQVSVDKDWRYIQVLEIVQTNIYKIPFIAPVEWYVFHSIHNNRKYFFEDKIKKQIGKETEAQKRQQRSRAIEVVGVELGQLGRASLRVNGNVNVSGKMIFQDQELIRSSITETQSTQIKIDQTQHLNIEGAIGDRVTVAMDQDSERDFDWENTIRVTYQGKEDEIIQKIEAGNISLSLPSTQYVTFSGQNKGLFGLKALAKLGPIDITAIASVERTKKEKQSYRGSMQPQTQIIKDYDYVRNKYFFIHEWFRNGVETSLSGIPTVIYPFYPLQEGLHRLGNVKIVNFEMYQLDISNNPGADVGVAYIDPLNPTTNEDDNKSGNFLRMERDLDYIVNEDLGFVRLKALNQDQIIACHYSLINSTSGDTLVTIGHGITQSDSTLALKMIKPQAPHPNHPTWDLMFKNVYNLGSSNINSEGFTVKIINNRVTPLSERDSKGVPYLTQFGLDSLNESGARTYDEKIDLENPNIVNLILGELHFPALLPFVSADSITGGNANTEIQGHLGSGKMYTTTIHSQYSGDSRFSIEADYSNPSSTINLGFMVVEGSEEVFRGGNKLSRGLDYQIDYLSGTIVMLDETADPNADIEVNFDKHELVSFDKKVILGTRAQMDLGPKSFIGVTALYYNQSVINEKIEVGYEPTRNFIWDINGRFETNLDGFTRLLDRLPVIDTEEISVLSVEGEIAQVIPNPNPISNNKTGDPNGVAFIDDFEGSKRSTIPSNLRQHWKASSAPIDRSTGQAFSQRNRARMFWYNPFGKVLTKSIWPNTSTSVTAQNETVDILVLDYSIKEHQKGLTPDSVWAGITSSLNSGEFDQTQSKFFEIWLNGDRGKLTVDLGKISEDMDGNGKLNTEDIPEAGLTLGNGFLEDHEDIGLDGCPDEYEDGWGGCLDPNGPSYADYRNSGENQLINASSDVNLEDPNGDNWFYQENSNEYDQVNGTEGNGTGVQIQQGGKYPDTEDLDQSGFLDKTNDYFTKSFTLNDSTYLAGETEDNGIPTGWRLFRVPLSHFEKIRDIEWNEIRYMRLSWSGLEEDARLYIAKVELVGNDWQELGVAADTSETYSKLDSLFAISVVNTEDNADYQPPKGVKGEYDQINDIRSKEQSLVLNFANLPPGYKAAANKTLIALSGRRAQSYLTYNDLKMYVYGKSPWIGIEDTDVEIFLRFGIGDSYYEITQPVYSGWDEERDRNSINLDLNWLTRLKLQDEITVKKIRPTDIFIDSADVKIYQFTDEDGSLNRRRVRIKGEPALSRLQYFIAGIRNTANEPITGEVWLDELRLSDVKKDRGIAMRMQSNLKIADLGKTSVLYSRRDADFHVLQERLSSNSTKQDLRINSTFQLQKFLPKSWGIVLPLNTSFSNILETPKYLPGTDILTGESAPDSILTKSNRISLSSSLSKPSKSENKWIRYTLDNISASGSFTRVVNSNVTMVEVRNEAYTGKLAYIHTFGRDNFFQPFKWLRFIPLMGKKFSEMNVYYTPANISTSIDFSQKLVQKNSRTGGKTPDEYNLGLNRALNMNYKITDNLETRYSTGLKNDLDVFRDRPWKALQEFDPGILTNTNQSLQTQYNPEISNWFKPKISYSTTYRWDKPIGSTIEGANLNSQVRFSTNVSINPVTIVNSYNRSKEPKVEESGRRRRMISEEADQMDEEKDDYFPERQGKSGKQRGIKDKLLQYLKKINTINIVYTENLNRSSRGVLGTIPTGYKFGWLPSHGLQYSDEVGTNTGTWQYQRSLAVRSGVSLTETTKLNLNFGQDFNNVESGSGIIQKTIVRDYIAFGEQLDKGLPFVGWSLQMTGLEKWPIFRLFARSVSLEHAFSGKETRTYKLDGADIPNVGFLNAGTFIDDYNDFLTSANIVSSYSPLLGLSISMARGISLNIRHTAVKTTNEMPTGLTLKSDQSWSISSNYNHRGGLTIPLPLLNDLKIQNNMNFLVNIDINKSETWGTKNKTELAKQTFNTGWKAGARVSYSFSSWVSGSIILEYRESDSKTTGKKVDRDIGFDINLSISG